MSVAALIAVLVLELLPASPSASASVDPTAGKYGFAVYLLGGFFALGLIMLVAFLFSRKPRSATR